MANVNFFSPDGGITRYPLEDTEGRIAYADDIDGINLFEPVNVGLISPETVGEGTFIGNSGNTAVVARIEHNTEYIARHEGGNRFRLALSMEKPVVGGACYTVVNDADAKSYTFNSGNYNYVLLHCNNVALSLDTIKPMCYKSVYGANFPYRPYNQQSIQHQINDITGVTGVRNRLKINISTQVINGITFTVNKDDNGNVLSITANGTATANADIDVFNSSSNPIIGEYIVTGTPKTGSADTYYLTCNIPSNPAGYRWPKDEGKGVRLTSNDSCTIIRLSILSGQTVSNVVFKPMLRSASDPDDTYVPYAMTNRELTEVVDITDQFTASTGVNLNSFTTLVKKWGKYISGCIRLTTPATVSANCPVIQIGSKARTENTNPFPIGIAYVTWQKDPFCMVYIENNTIILSGSNWTASTDIMIFVNYISE